MVGTIDFPTESVLKRSLIWEHKNPQTKSVDVYTYPLERKAAMEYWEKEVKSGENQSAKSILSRIRNGSHKLDRERQLYDRYPNRTALIDHLLYSASKLCSIHNVSRRTGSHYASAITSLVRFFVETFSDVYDIEQIDEHKQSVLFAKLSDVDSDFYSGTSVRTIAKNILVESLEREGIPCDILKRNIKGNTHHGPKSRMDYPQEVILQLLAITVEEIHTIKRRYAKYLNYRKTFDGKPFDSLENLAKAYLTVPHTFLGRKTHQGRKAAIDLYRRHYDRLAWHLHGMSLKELDTEKLETLARSAHNIDDLDDPFVMAWFMDDILVNYPFRTGRDEGSVADVPMSRYTRWNTDMSLRQFLHGRGRRRGKDFMATFTKQFELKYPTAEQVIPFVLYWLVQTGCNPEGLVNIRRKEKGENGFAHIGELGPLGDTPVIRSFKNRGSKNYYWFVLDPNEKDGLFAHYEFLKSFLTPLWEADDRFSDRRGTWPFWVYYSPSKSRKVVHLTWSNLKNRLDLYVEEHEILMPDGTLLKSLEPSRLRNSFITMADLQGSSIEEIQDWIKHGEFDTRFKYYANSSDMRSRNFRAIHAIQEDIMEQARKFEGAIKKGSLREAISSRQVQPTYLCGCGNANDPSYVGAKPLPDNVICVDWDMCLSCENSRVFREHLSRICARILQYEEFQVGMTADEWENNFGTKHRVALDALERWVEDGGLREDVDEAWEIAKSGKIELPPIFPTGYVSLEKRSTDVA